MPRSKAKKRTKKTPTRDVAWSVDLNEPLPPTIGPKLSAFNLHDRSIEFVGLLSAEQPGRHSHVFEVFKFYDSGEHELGLAGRNVPLDMIVGHLDPFYAECRAYGRIAERNRKRPVAVPCYGFLGIPAAQEDFFSATFDISDWDRPEEEYDRSIADRQSFRAIIKELVTDPVPFRKNMVRGMLADLRSLRNMTVFVRDIRADNYCGGKLVDFSVSWTVPHLMLADGLRDMDLIEEDIMEELFTFDKMIEDSGIVTPVRATRNKVYTSKLRPRKKIRY